MSKCVQGHTAYIFDRGGENRVDQLLDLSQVKWERNRDGVSDASVRLEADSCSAQAKLIDSLRTHRHELVIFRGDDRVWEGPLHRIATYHDHVEIFAKDVLAYLFATPLTRAWSNRAPNQGPMTTRLREIIEWELTHDRVQRVGGTAGYDVTVTAWENLDTPVNLVEHLDVRNFPNEAQTAAYTMPYEMTVGDHLANAGRQGGIDFTAIGRRICIWDVSRDLGTLEPMTEANFVNSIITTEYGADHAQSAYVVSEDGAVGQALNEDHLDYYGPWTTIFTAYNEEGGEGPTQSELNSQAIRNLAGRSPAPVEVRVPDNSGIFLTDSLSINDLVCGVKIPLRATLNARPLYQMQKLDHVTVTEDSEGENIQVTLTPATRPDENEAPE